MQLKNISGLEITIPSLGVFAIGETLDFGENYYSNILEVPVFDAINNDQLIFVVDGSDKTKNESLEIWHGGRAVWVVTDGLVSKNAFIQLQGKQFSIRPNTLNDSQVPEMGFSPDISTQTTNNSITLVWSFTPDPDTLYDIDVYARALISTKEKGFQNQMKGLVVNQDLIASEVIYREGERGLRVVLAKDGADIKILIRGKNSQTWDWKTQICVSEVK